MRNAIIQVLRVVGFGVFTSPLVTRVFGLEVGTAWLDLVFGFGTVLGVLLVILDLLPAWAEHSRVVADFVRELDRIAFPRLDTPPGMASVAIWCLAHLVICILVGTVAVSTQSMTHPFQLGMAGLWIATVSATPFRAALLLGDRVPTPARMRPAVVESSTSNRVAFALSVTAVAVEAVGGIGTLTGACVTVGSAMIVGSRIAGVDAWTRQVRPIGFYLRTAISWNGLSLALAFTTMVYLIQNTPFSLGNLDDFKVPFVGTVGQLETPTNQTISDMVEGTESLLDQYVDMMLVVFGVGLFPALAMAEMIASVARRESTALIELEVSRRAAERAGVGQRLESTAIADLDRIASRARDAEQVKLIDRLRQELVDLGVDLDAAKQTGTVAIEQCLDEVRDATSTLPLVIVAALSEATAEQPLPTESAVLLQRLLLVQIGNSNNAGASRSDVSIRLIDGEAVVEYWDDGPGFDPESVVGHGGGLDEMIHRLDEVGGRLLFRRQGGHLRSIATWNIHEQHPTH